MRAITVAAAAMTVFVLAMVMLASPVAAPAASTYGTTDRCLLCHPQAHADDWLKSHGQTLQTDAQSMTVCADCHTAQSCTDCHTADGIDVSGM